MAIRVPIIAVAGNYDGDGYASETPTGFREIPQTDQFPVANIPEIPQSKVTDLTSALDALTTALEDKAPKDSPVLTGTPTAPTAEPGSNTTQIATTAFVRAAVAALVDSAPEALDTLNELAAALGDDPNFATTVTNALAGKEPAIDAGTTSQYWRGDKTWQTLDAAAVGLGNVPNVDATNRANHTGTQTASTISNFDAAVNALIGVAEISADQLTGTKTSAFISDFSSAVNTLIGNANIAASQITGTKTSSFISDFASAVPGALPDQSGNAGKFLTTDGSSLSWDTPAGGGAGVSDEAYDPNTWDGVTGTAPSKNAVRDKFVSVDSAIAGKADSGHNHDGDYAAVYHDHDGDYASISHSHTASEITDFATAVSWHSDVIANTSARHSHENSVLLDSLTDAGAGDKFLADDGNYKEIEAGAVDGNGTAGKLPVFTGTTDIGDSSVSESNDQVAVGKNLVVDAQNTDAAGMHINHPLVNSTDKVLVVQKTGGSEVFSVANAIVTFSSPSVGGSLYLRSNASGRGAHISGANNAIQIAGMIRYTMTTVNLTSDQVGLSLNSNTVGRYIRLTADDDYIIGGLVISAGGIPRDHGNAYTFINVSEYTITFKHEYEDQATAAYRFLTVDGNDVVLNPNERVEVVYDGNTSRFRIWKMN